MQLPLTVTPNDKNGSIVADGGDPADLAVSLWAVSLWGVSLLACSMQGRTSPNSNQSEQFSAVLVVSGTTLL